MTSSSMHSVVSSSSLCGRSAVLRISIGINHEYPQSDRIGFSVAKWTSPITWGCVKAMCCPSEPEPRANATFIYSGDCEMLRIGPVRKAVLAFDLGTTYSGVAYTILDPQEVPVIHTVTRYPGQSNAEAKIPSILLYTKDGQVRAVGAEAKDPRMDDIIEEEELIVVEWFKLHLVPKSMGSSIRLQNLDVQTNLPPGKTVIDVVADFLAYMYKCARDYIIEVNANGASIWNSVKDRVEIVLSHPNGWEGLQQGKMREAAVLAGLAPDSDIGQARIHFVSEGEASLHYCVDMGMTKDFEDETGVLIIDAGGGTVDLSSYCFISTSPIAVEETTPTECLLQGSTRVNIRAASLFKTKFANSKFNQDMDIKAMLEAFEKTAKPNFKDSKEKSFIKFGSLRDTDAAFKINRGQFALEGTEVAQLFEPSVNAIVEAVRKQNNASLEPISFAFLVGGFAASAWLFSRLKERLAILGICLSRPDHHANKAVAAGAASYFIEHFVSARVARWTYGTSCSVDYDDSDPEHLAREHLTYTRATGIRAVPVGFSSVIIKGTRLREGEECIKEFVRETQYPRVLNHISTEIICYRGRDEDPQWMDVDPDYFTELCVVTANTTNVAKTKRWGPRGLYYEQSFQIVLSSGKTEMTAQIRWEENGVERRGPAKIVYDDDARVAR